ncbi:S-layer homology domain-containing protein [Paenisporosarcina quisquiliarum]|uniref:S-layer homology domain-containing protein n=1 Tax=Paenisporosarcina quisquiliarum TaxID=365346 RepID=UPI00373631DC
MKYFFYVTMIFSILLTFSLPNEVFAKGKQYHDVVGLWAEMEINYLSGEGVISGYPDGLFRPNKEITRFQAAAMLKKALNIPTNDSLNSIFKDISKESPMYGIAATMNELGIMRGSNGYFRPGESLSRAQMAVILRRAYELPHTERPFFIDVEPNHWAFFDINSLTEERIAGGYPDGSFKPSNAVTRAQYSVFLARAMDDNLKLGSAKQKVALTGKSITYDGYRYSFTSQFPNSVEKDYIVKRNLSSKTDSVLVDASKLVDSEGYPYLMEDDFGGSEGALFEREMMIYGNELYYLIFPEMNFNITQVKQSTLMKVSLNGGKSEPVFKKVFAYGSEGYKSLDGKRRLDGLGPIATKKVRNYTIWNDKIYFIKSVEKHTGLDIVSQENLSKKGENVSLYISDLNGTNVRPLKTLNIFTYSNVENQPYYDTVAIDHSSIYFANENGVFELDLSTLNTIKISKIVASEISTDINFVYITDFNGNKRKIKK